MKATGFFFIHFSHNQLLSFMITGQLATVLEPTSQNSAIQKIKYGQFAEEGVKENNNFKADHTGDN